MKKLLPIVILVMSVILGASGGLAVKTFLAPKSAAAEGSASESDAHGEKGGHAGAPTSAFVKFSRQFVVPASAASNGALIIIDLNLEVAPEADQRAYALEPKLRDACLGALLRLSAEGRLAEVMTSSQSAASAKAALLDAAKTVLGDSARDVLITDIAIQGM